LRQAALDATREKSHVSRLVRRHRPAGTAASRRHAGRTTRRAAVAVIVSTLFAFASSAHAQQAIQIDPSTVLLWGVSDENATRVYDLARGLESGDCLFDGMTVTPKAMELRWVAPGRSVPTVIVGPTDPSSPREFASMPLMVTLPTNIAAVCPDLAKSLTELNESLSNDPSALLENATKGGERLVIPRLLGPSLAGGLVVLLIVAAILLGMGARRRFRGAQPRTAWLLVAAMVALPMVAESMYRAAMRSLYGSRQPQGQVFALYNAGTSTFTGELFVGEMSISGLVSDMLGRKIGDRPIVVSNVAAPAGQEAEQVARLERALRFHDRSVPGVVLIYAGSDDLSGSDPVQRRSRQTLRGSWLFRDTASLLRAAHVLSAPRGLDGYASAMQAMVELSLDAGLTPVLVAAPTHIGGGDSSAFVRAGISAAALTIEGFSLERLQQNEAAASYFREKAATLTTEHPLVAMLMQYRADHLDRGAGHATPAQLEILRRLAKEDGVRLVDPFKLIGGSSPEFLLSQDVLTEQRFRFWKGYGGLAAFSANELLTVFPGSNGATREPADPLLEMHLRAGTWAFSSAVREQWLTDRLVRGEEHLWAATEGSDPFTAWLGIGLSQATRIGELLSQQENVELITRSEVLGRTQFRIAEKDWPVLIDLLRQAKIEPEVLGKIEELWPKVAHLQAAEK
jgi:hypothetical protein